ncbi:MAG: hypothetical protein H6730_27985 [Deltaproteobacteria bacterium]|nr:hypothetical protein [Deltaproteobacteria bacterium]
MRRLPRDATFGEESSHPGRLGRGRGRCEVRGLGAGDVGELDQNAPLSDTLHLANDYGSATGAGPASVVEIAGARLIPRIEPAPRNEAHWNALIQFLDP